MLDSHLFECGCGNVHRYRGDITPPKAPPGWQIGRDGKPVCDDCVSAKSARRTRRAA